MARVTYSYDSTQPGTAQFLTELEAAVSSFGVRLLAAAVRDAAEIEQALDMLVREPNGGLFVYAGRATNAHRELIITLTRRYRIPAVYGYRYFVTMGGLVSYGVDATDQYRRALQLWVRPVSSLLIRAPKRRVTPLFQRLEPSNSGTAAAARRSARIAAYPTWRGGRSRASPVKLMSKDAAPRLRTLRPDSSASDRAVDPAARPMAAIAPFSKPEADR